MVSSNPREGHGLRIFHWSLRILVGPLMYYKNIGRISHIEIRSILIKYEIIWRKSETILSNKDNDPGFDLKKKYIQNKI